MATIGYTTIGGSTDYDPLDYMEITGPFLKTGTETTSVMSAYIQAATVLNAPTRGVIYNDSSGTPGTLVTTSTEVIIVGGAATAWVDFPLPAVPTLTNGSSYWLGIWTGGVFGTSGWTNVAGTTAKFFFDTWADYATHRGIYVSGQTYSATNPAASPWPAGTNLNEKISIYATTSSGVAVGIPARVNMPAFVEIRPH